MVEYQNTDSKNSQSPVEETHREFCYTCFKPSVVCICNEIVPVNNRTKIVILQHKCERGHPIGTARIASLGLRNMELLEVWPDENRRFTVKPVSDQGVGLLFPGPSARDLAEVGPEEKPEKLIVLDGTWGDVKGLRRDNPWLADLPQFSLNPTTPSRYRIRKEPDDKSISTIEAIVQSLSILEPDTKGLDSLIATFDSMIDRQITHAFSDTKKVAAPRFKRPRQKMLKALPVELKEDYDNLLVANGETVPHGAKKRALVQWVAIRPSDGAVFEQFIIPDRETIITDDHLELMHLSNKDMSRAVSAEELKRLWNEFKKPDDVLVTWTHGDLRLFEQIAGREQSSFFLKEAYCNAKGGKCGHIGDVVRFHKMPLIALPVRGRAGRQLSETVAVAKFLNQLDLNASRPYSNRHKKM